MYKLYNGDCLEVMDKLIKEGVVPDSKATTILEAKDEILKAFQMK